MKKIALFLALILISNPIYVYARPIRPISEVIADYVPAPVLLTPIVTEIQSGEADMVQFKWSPHEGDAGKRDYYEFKIYKGYDMLEETLIFKERLSGDNYQYNISADRFEKGQVYTWALRQAYNSGNRSDWAHASFNLKR